MAAICVAVVLAPAFAIAQDTVYIGGSGRASVEIHLDVLDGLPPAPPGQGPRLVYPGQEINDGPIRLRPPSQVTVTRAPKPRLRPMAQETTPSEPEPSPTVVREPEPVEVMVRNEPREPEPIVPAPEPEPIVEAPPPEPVVPEPAPRAEPEPAAPVEPERAVVRADPEPERVKPAPEPPPARAEPTPEPKEPKREAESPRVASLDASASIEPGEILEIGFAPSAADLPAGADTVLAAVGQQLDSDEDLRVQLKAYAGGDTESASQARRLSLSRALAVRSFLIEQGVRSTRIDVRALGNRSEAGPGDRVDVILMKR